MNITELLQFLRRANVRLWLEGEKLRYSAPANALGPDELAALAAHKSELVEMLRRNATSASALPPIEKHQSSTPIPISLEQERLWFLEQLNGSNPTYNVTAGWHLHGPLNIEALVASFEEIVSRHGSLRTTFREIDGKVYQQIAPQLALEVPIVDIEADAVGTHAEEFAFRSFDLANGPLIHAELLRLAADHHVLLLNGHHIVIDGWSVGILVRELLALYESKIRNEQSPLAPLTIQYGDYAVWQRERLPQQILKSQLAYWQQQLEGLAPLLELPADRPRPPVQSHNGAKLAFDLSGSLSQRLLELSRSERCTPFMILLTAFIVVLARFTGQTDIAVGSPVANRLSSKLENLIGFFVNTVTIRTKLNHNPTWKQLIQTIKETTLAAHANRVVPFEQVVGALAPERSLSFSPLFQAEFILQNSPATHFALHDVTVSELTQERVATKFDITMAMFETAKGLAGHIIYAVDLFDRTTVQRLIESYQQLLVSMVENTDQRVLDASILTASQRAQLDQWNNTAFPVNDSCIHQLFEAQVEKTPDAEAVVYKGQSLTYRELNLRANSFAHRLMAFGVGPETVVGICVNRSLDLFICLLGILKTGAAYLPLDPTYPEERLKVIIEEAQSPVIVTANDALTIEVEGFNKISLDDRENDGQQVSEDAPVSHVSPLNLCYVIYTSGSTGKPKGIAMSHQAVANLVNWYNTTYPLAEKPRTLQFASINFDVSFEEMFTTWTVGGTLFALDAEDRLDPYRLLELICEASINRMFIPVVVLQQIAQAFCESKQAPVPDLNQVITAGSQLQITDEIKQFFAAMPNAELHNNYGPSETHSMTRYPLSRTIEEWETLPPIGMPIHNCTVYLLDDRDQLVPAGVTGEACIGGLPVARGYLNRPDLTAEKFFPDPFSNEPGMRLYRSGDLVRRRADGNLEWLARKDFQVKVRGFRVELGEIEAVLRQHPSVQEVLVMAQLDRMQNAQLIAYVQVDRNDADLSSEFRRFLKLSLPDYAVPSAFVLLASMPLNANGKIDRKRLPAPDFSLEVDRNYARPRTRNEEILCEMWAELLALDRVGIHDNFFEIGGHSLFAMQVISRIRSAFKVELPITAIFEAPQIATLAQRLEDLLLEHAVIAESDSLVDNNEVDEDELVI
jgi:amino acid adenylation domain-containing protein